VNHWLGILGGFNAKKDEQGELGGRKITISGDLKLTESLMKKHGKL
jgi:hypothetical protein